VLHALAPRHLRDVDQAFDTGLEFDERAVIGQADHLAGHADAGGVTLHDVAPRIRYQLLVAERDALGGRVVLEDDDVDVVADLDHFRGVRDAAPRHVRDVQEAVDAAQVNERTVVGEVLDRAAQHLAVGEGIERDLLLLGVFFFKQRLARQHDVAPLLVDLDDAHAEFLALEGIQVAHGPHVDLRTREEGTHADVDGESTLDAFDDAADDHAAIEEGLFDLVPDLHLLGFFARQHDVAFAILGALQEHVHHVAGLRRDVTVFVDEFFDGDDAFGFEADIHHNFGRGDLHHGALDDFTFREIPEAGIVKVQHSRVLLLVDIKVGVHCGKA